MVASGCVAQVGTTAVGDLSGSREGADRGDHGTPAPYGWAFDRSIRMLDCTAAEWGIGVERVDARDTSEPYASPGSTDDSQRVERGCPSVRGVDWSPTLA